MGVLDDSFGELEREAATDELAAHVDAEAVAALIAVRQELEAAVAEAPGIAYGAARISPAASAALAHRVPAVRLAQMLRGHAKDLRGAHAILIGDVHRLLRDHGGGLATDRWTDLATALRERLARRDADVARLESRNAELATRLEAQQDRAKRAEERAADAGSIEAALAKNVDPDRLVSDREWRDRLDDGSDGGPFSRHRDSMG